MESTHKGEFKEIAEKVRGLLSQGISIADIIKLSYAHINCSSVYKERINRLKLKANK